MNYYKALQTVTDEATPATGSRVELEQQLQRINEALKGPMPNFMRIELCADRASIRKALATPAPK